MQIRNFGKCGDARWHEIEKRNEDVLEAMNIPGGVLLRTTNATLEWADEQTRIPTLAVSMITVERLVVAQQWAVEVIDADDDDDDDDEATEAFIALRRRVFLSTTVKLNDEAEARWS